jgi:PAN domain
MSYRKITIALGSWLCIHALGGVAFAQLGNLHEGQYLFPGQKMIASGCYFETIMQSDGNLVTYENANSQGAAWWASGTNGVGGYATLQEDNNFVIYDWSDRPVWATGTNGKGSDYLVQQNDGNLVLYSLSNHPFWASGHVGEPIGQSPCEVSSVVTQVHLDTNIPGGDYNHFALPVARPSWCGYYCSQDSKCQAYTYVPPGVQGSQAVCWLKNNIQQFSGASGMVSGYKIWN